MDYSNLILKVLKSPAPYSPYKILSTDYNSYAAVYSCIPLLFFKIEFAWILARASNTSSGNLTKSVEQIKQIYRDNGIDTSPFFDVAQDCGNNYVLSDNGTRQASDQSQNFVDFGTTMAAAAVAGGQNLEAEESGVSTADRNFADFETTTAAAASTVGQQLKLDDGAVWADRATKEVATTQKNTQNSTSSFTSHDDRISHVTATQNLVDFQPATAAAGRQELSVNNGAPLAVRAPPEEESLIPNFFRFFRFFFL